MGDQLSSYFAGTFALAVVLGVAGVIGLARPWISRDPRLRSRFGIAVSLAILAQLAHFLEELHTSFFVRFPTQLGLAPWTESFFVMFNVAWLVIWVVSSVAVLRGVVFALVPIWFLALAQVLNLVAHPLLAWMAGAYFPGLYTGVVGGIFGGLLLWVLIAITNQGERVV